MSAKYVSHETCGHNKLCPYIGCIQFMFVFTVKVLSIQHICGWPAGAYLLADKSLPFGLQKTVFCRPKAYLLQTLWLSTVYKTLSKSPSLQFFPFFRLCLTHGHFFRLPRADIPQGQWHQASIARMRNTLFISRLSSLRPYLAPAVGPCGCFVKIITMPFSPSPAVDTL